MNNGLGVYAKNKGGVLQRRLMALDGEATLPDSTPDAEVIDFSELSFYYYAVIIDKLITCQPFLVKKDTGGFDTNVYEFMTEREILYPAHEGGGEIVVSVIVQCRAEKSREQWVRAVGTALELRMVLHADVERQRCQLHRFHKAAVRRQAAECQPRFRQRLAVVVVELVAVAVALGDLRCAIAARHSGTRRDRAGIAAETERAAFVNLVALPRHEVDDLAAAQLVKLAGVGVGESRDVPRELDHRDLHSKA